METEKDEDINVKTEEDSQKKKSDRLGGDTFIDTGNVIQ